MIWGSRVDRLRDGQALAHVVEPRRLIELVLRAADVEQRLGTDLVRLQGLGHRQSLLAQLECFLVATCEIGIASARAPHRRLRASHRLVRDERRCELQLLGKIVLAADQVPTEREQDAGFCRECDVP